MKYRTLGRTGIQVSPYCLGAMMFGAIGNPDHDDSIRIIHKALDSGINVIDTADVYSRGESEEIVGKALKGRRDNVVLATKLSGAMGEDPNQRGTSRRWIMTAVEDSLRRLGTDHIDLYQLHRLDHTVDLEDTLSALTDLVRSGKVRAVGSSAFPASTIVEAQWIAESRGLQRLRTEQPAYSILDRGIEREILPIAEKYGIGTLVWSPLAQGMLTGRYRKGQQADTHRGGLFKHYSDERRLDAVEELIPLAERLRHQAHPPGDGVRGLPPRGHLGHHRPAHHGTPGRPARRCRHHAGRRLCWTRSTPSSLPAPTSAGSTWPTSRKRSSRSACAAAHSKNAPRPSRGGRRTGSAPRSRSRRARRTGAYGTARCRPGRPSSPRRGRSTRRPAGAAGAG